MTAFDKFQKILVTFLILVSVFFGGYYFGVRGFEINLKKNPPDIEVVNKAPYDSKIDFKIFWDVWDILSADYLLRPVDSKKMLYGAIKGMVAALDDPYTSFLPPEENKSLSSALNGVYEGIGAELGIKDGQLIVVAPLDGSPSKAAGIRAGDMVLEIEGVSTFGITLTEAVGKIRGPSGTVSTLTIARKDVEPFTVKIKRGKIVVESVTWEDKNDGIAYIRISRFGGDTNENWDKVASEVNVKMRTLNAIILDLRGNPGGYLQSAVHIAGEFFRDKPVLFQEDAFGTQEALDTNRIGTFNGVPVIVLIDGGSASASEILAAALKFHIDAKLVGVKSFGKGTIQDARDFADGSGIHITIAKWLTPAKEWVHKNGIKPDVEVEYVSEGEYNPEKDKQLLKAIEIAKSL